jgi:similar to stage IV sporulation protein
MLFIRFLRFLRGYYYFCASDGFPERFLNLCNQKGVVIWDLAWRKGVMCGKTDRHGFRLMQECALPAGIALAEEKRVGLPFFLHSYRRRCGLLAGLLLLITTLSALSGMVWTIEVQGNDRVPAEEILQVMETQGVTLGVWRVKLNAKAISEAALPQLPELSWISLNLRGSSAVIEVREMLPVDLQDSNAPQNIVAAKAGQLTTLEIYAGSAEARLGQAVLPGDLLAGAVITNFDSTTRAVHASAYAVARTAVICTGAAPRRESVVRVSKTKTHYTLRLLNFNIPLGPMPKNTQDATIFEDCFTWAPAGRVLPLSLLRRTCLTTAPQQNIKNDRQLQLAAAKAFFDTSYDTLRAAQVLSQQVAVNLQEDGCTVDMEGAAYENIGVADEVSQEQ